MLLNFYRGKVIRQLRFIMPFIFYIIYINQCLIFLKPQVTTFSRLLTASEIEPLEKMVHSVELLSLQQFDTEHSFLKKIRFVDVDMEMNIIK